MPLAPVSLVVPWLAFEAGDAEVGNLGGPTSSQGAPRLAVEQDVRRLQIEVGPAPRAWKYPTARAIVSGESGGIKRQERLRQSILERAPGHILEHEPEPFLGLAHAMDRHDLVMRHPRERARFTEPVLARVGINQRVPREELHGDVAIQRGLPREVNDVCSAPAKRALDDETGKRRRECLRSTLRTLDRWRLTATRAASRTF